MSTSEPRPVPQRGKRYDRDQHKARLRELVVEQRRSFCEVGRRVEMDPATVRRWAIDWGWYDPDSRTIVAGDEDADPPTAPINQIAGASAVLRQNGRSRVRPHEIAQHTIDLSRYQVGWHLQYPTVREECGVEIWRQTDNDTTYMLTEVDG